MNVSVIIGLAGVATAFVGGLVGVVMFVASMNGRINALDDDYSMMSGILVNDRTTAHMECMSKVSKLEAELRKK